MTTRDSLERKNLARLHGKDVNHTAGRGDDNVRAALEVTDLLGYAGTAVDCGGSEMGKEKKEHQLR